MESRVQKTLFKLLVAREYGMFLSPTEPIDDVLNQALIEKAEKHPLVHKAQVKKLDAEVINAQKHETYLKIKKEFAEDVEYMV